MQSFLNGIFKKIILKNPFFLLHSKMGFDLNSGTTSLKSAPVPYFMEGLGCQNSVRALLLTTYGYYNKKRLPMLLVVYFGA